MEDMSEQRMLTYDVKNKDSYQVEIEAVSGTILEYIKIME